MLGEHVEHPRGPGGVGAVVERQREASGRGRRALVARSPVRLTTGPPRRISSSSGMGKSAAGGPGSCLTDDVGHVAVERQRGCDQQHADGEQEPVSPGRGRAAGAAAGLIA